MTDRRAHTHAARLWVWGLVALVPVVLIDGLEGLVDIRPLPVHGELFSAALALGGVAVLAVLAGRYRRLEADFRHQASAAISRFEVQAAERLDAVDKRARIRDLVRAGDRLHIVYQPVFDLADRRVTGYEALSRFEDGTPAGWFAEAHDLGMGVELELLAARRAIDGFQPGHGRLGINLSPATLLTEDLYELFADAIEHLDLVIEITEHAAVADYDQLLETLSPIRKLGVLVAIDDTGAGFASFRHVLALKPDIVKLDRSMIAGIATDDTRASLAHSLSRFARSQGIRLIAEGIETEDELTACRSLGIEAGQGFLVGRPAALPVVESEHPRR